MVVPDFKFENEFDRSWKLNLTEKSGNVSFGPNELERWKKTVSIRTSKDGNSGGSVKSVLFLDDLSVVWINKLWKGPTFGSWSKYTSKNVLGVGCFVILVPETTWTWIFQKCAEMAKKHLYFMIRSRLFGRFVRSVGRGAVLFGLLGVGAFYYDTGSVGRFCTCCDWCKRGCRGVGRVLPEFQKRGNGRGVVL